jgi:hypothetical protein
MKDFYFTFGQGHYTTDGIHMNNSWVRVTAPDEDKARQYFRDNFAQVMMGDPNKFAQQKDAEHFKPQFFPAGEFEHLTYPEETT